MSKRILIFLTTLTAGLLHADSLTYTITPNAGQFLYEFTLTNSGATGGTLFDLFLSLPTDIGNIDTATIGTPVGWGDGNGGLLFFGPDASPSAAFIEWAADGSTLFDLGVGDSLSGFAFNSSVDVGTPILFALNGATDFATAQGIPEPGTGWLVFAPLALLGWRVWARSSRQTGCG